MDRVRGILILKVWPPSGVDKALDYGLIFLNQFLLIGDIEPICLLLLDIKESD